MRLCLLLFFASLSTVLAHGPTVEVNEPTVVRSPDGTFLETRIDPPDGGTRLLAASTPFGGAVFEEASDSGYRKVDHLKLEHGSGDFGLESVHRVRLPDIPEGRRTLPLTLLFAGGTVVQAQASVESRGKASYTRLLWLTAPAGVLLLVLLQVSRADRRKRRLRGSRS